MNIPINPLEFGVIQALRQDHPTSGFDLQDIELQTEVCRDCEGSGITWNGITLFASDFDEDPDLHSRVMEGAFDRPCEECNGNKVLRYVNYDAAKTPSLEALEAATLEGLEWKMQEAAERAAGC